jgi:hypothetical protein
MGAEGIADAGGMGAWKLRALVYGLLLVIAALVVLSRQHHDGRPPIDSLTSDPAQSPRANFYLRDGRIASFRVYGIEMACHNGSRHRWTWFGSPTRPTMTWSARGTSLDVHDRLRGFDLWLRGRMTGDNRAVEGTVTVTERGHGHGICESGSLHFEAAA